MDHQDYQKYRNYQVTDFVLNLSFQYWAQGNEDPFWSHFQETHPEKREMILEAIALVDQLQLQQRPLSSRYIEAQLAMIHATIDQRVRPAPVALPWYRIPLFRYAAAVVGLLFVSALFYFYQATTDRVYATAYQETQTIQLDDGTKVVLNSNSSLRVPSHIETAAVREVWLDGEAFFMVNPSVASSGPQQFVVHTSQLKVEVLGTVFNVKSRSGGTEVLLEEGSVRIVRPKTQERLLMTPGEVVEVAAADQKIIKKSSTPDALAWRENAFNFRDVPMAAVAQQIYDYYGKTVRFSDPAMADYRFTAQVSRDDLELLISLIETAFSVQVTIVDQDTIIVTQK